MSDLSRRTPMSVTRLLRLLPLAGLLLACSPPEPAGGHLQMAVLSSQPHLVTGGAALIEVTHFTDAESRRFSQAPDLTVNGQPARGLRLVSAEDGERIYRQTLEGLPEGRSDVVVQAGPASASLTLVNYPATGPVFSGEALTPYFCLGELAPAPDGSARRFAIGNGEYLDADAMDEHCSLPEPRVDYVYRSIDNNSFLPLPDLSVRPTDVDMVNDADGNPYPYIVRLETGTLNRAIYQIALLHDPLTPPPTPVELTPAWNQRLVYTFGGGCEAGFFQGTSTGGVLRDMMLSQGYAVASSTLNVNAQGGCNDVLSAETAMMVKAHFTNRYGPPLHTIGFGGSGGAMQQLLIAGAYPGILDGLLLGMSFADATTYFIDSRECVQFREFANDPARALSDDVKAAIGGWPDWYLCDESLGSRPDRISPYDCPAMIPESQRYHAVDNPDGVRCSIYDGMRNVFGTALYSDSNTQRPFARSPHDNVGVQYGLQALNEGIIDTTLFLDLNEAFGGWDIDGQRTAQRTQGDAEAIRIAYETGRVSNGSAGLSRVPIIDSRLYLDDEGNFHASVYSFVTRARLERDNGHSGNYIIRRHGRGMSLDAENLALMDQWLTALRARYDGLVDPDVIAAARPEALQDDCFDAEGRRIVEQAVFDGDGQCNSLYPPHAGLRLVAGGPLTNDVFKCELKAIDPDDYTVSFSEEEKQRLHRIFPEGVCDWQRPGVHQYSNDTWLSFGPSPVNRYRQ